MGNPCLNLYVCLFLDTKNVEFKHSKSKREANEEHCDWIEQQPATEAHILCDQEAPPITPRRDCCYCGGGIILPDHLPTPWKLRINFILEENLTFPQRSTERKGKSLLEPAQLRHLRFNEAYWVQPSKPDCSYESI